MSINPGQDGDWEEVSRRNRNRGGSSRGGGGGGGGGGRGRQWGAGAYGMIPRNNRDNWRPGPARGGRPHFMATPQIGIRQWAPKARVPEPKAETPEIPVMKEEEDDDDSFDDSDEDFNSDEDLDENPKSHESLKSHKLLKSFFETLSKLSVDEINEAGRNWHCPACKGGPGSVDWYKGLLPLVNHACTKTSRRAELHRVFAQTLKDELRMRGTSAGDEVWGKWEGLKNENQDHEILWPPIVMIMNTGHDIGDDNLWKGMSNDELLQLFISYNPQKAKHAYGPQGHRGFAVMKFESSCLGYMEAVRLHKHFLCQGFGREAFAKKQNMFSYGGKRQLFGFLATGDDLESFNLHFNGQAESQRIKYEMKSHHEMVVSEMVKMKEEHTQMFYFKNKAVKTERLLNALKDSVTFLSDKLREAMDQNRILKERSKMHHQQHQEEMDFQDSFLKERITEIQELLIAKDDSFEKFQQDEREKLEDSQDENKTG